MKKRFHDTEIWYKEWFMNLSEREKLGWFYLLDVCDGAGVWAPNFTLAETIIGKKVNWSKLMQDSHGNIEILENGKYFIPDFCEFQCVKLSAKSPPHRSYIMLLEKHGLLDRVVGPYRDWYEKRWEEHRAEEEQKLLSLAFKRSHR